MEQRLHSVSATQLDLAASVAEKVDIVDVRLIKLDAKCMLPKVTTPKLNRVSHTAKVKRDEGLQVFVHFAFQMADDTEDSRADPPVAITAVYCLAYNVEGVDALSDDQIEAFGKVNGIYNAWTFWRELVYTTLSRMGMPPVTMPVFRVVEGNGDDANNDAPPNDAFAEHEDGDAI
jgi:hypothetical protein